MKFKFEINLEGPEFEGDMFSRLQAVLDAMGTWLGTVEWRFDEEKVPRVRLPLPQDEFGASEKPIVNTDGGEIGRVGFYTVEPALDVHQQVRLETVERAVPPPFKAPVAKR